MPYVASITAYLCKDAIRGQYYRVYVLGCHTHQVLQCIFEGCHTWPVLLCICVRTLYVASITVYLCKDAIRGQYYRVSV